MVYDFEELLMFFCPISLISVACNNPGSGRYCRCTEDTRYNFSLMIFSQKIEQFYDF